MLRIDLWRLPDVSVVIGKERKVADKDFPVNKVSNRPADAGKPVIKHSHVYAATAAMAKGRTYIVPVLVMLMCLFGRYQRLCIVTTVVHIATGHQRKCHDVKSPYYREPFHCYANV